MAKRGKWALIALGGAGLFVLGTFVPSADTPSVTIGSRDPAGTSSAASTLPAVASNPATTIVMETRPQPTLVDVVDGDTIRARLPDGTVESVRLIGINAPEAGECLAEEATTTLASLLEKTELTLVPDVSERDQYGRLLRYVFAGDSFINEGIVESGLALSVAYPPDTAHQHELDQAQVRAQDASLGIWGTDPCGMGRTTGADLSIIGLAHNPEGDDNLVLNEEWVAIRNNDDEGVDLTGWTVRDESSTHRFAFPQGFTLEAGQVVVLHTGCGTASEQDLYWCNAGSAIWNNSGDTVMVLDPSGALHTSLPYEAGRVSDALSDVMASS